MSNKIKQRKLNRYVENDNLESVDYISMDIPLFIRMLEYAREDAKTDMDLHDVTENVLRISEKTDVLTMANYSDIVNVKEDIKKDKEEDVKEMTGADSSGAFATPMGEPIKREIHTLNNTKKYLSEDSVESSGEYDAPAFETSKKNPLKIAGPKAIEKRAREINKNKKFPKFGGPDGVFVKIKEKCKTFPYCDESPKAIELIREDKEFKEALTEVSKKRGIPYEYLENLVLNEIRNIFI